MEINLDDFVKDFRHHSHIDDVDWPFNNKLAPVEFSECNRSNLKEQFEKVKANAKAILEIGVCRNGGDSSTYVFLNNKNPNTFFIGIDLEDKCFLNDKDKNIYTIKTDSSNYKEIIDECNKLGVTEFDFIFIDGWHSINQCIRDWKFVANLAKNGIVGLHDTSNHPGPLALIHNVKQEKWNLEICCLDDNGISFLSKK